MSGVYGKHEDEEKCIQNFGGEPEGKKPHGGLTGR
jgi:hypothetical protein